MKRHLVGLIAGASVILSLVSLARTSSAKCVQESPCKCRDEETGKYVDLTGLANRDGQPAFTATETGGQQTNTFVYNPCLSFSTNSTSCENVAVCEINSATGGQYNLGLQFSATFVTSSLNPQGLAIRYQYNVESGISSRISYVELMCDPEQRVALFNFFREDPPGTFYFNLTSACACPGGCGEVRGRCEEIPGGRNCSCDLYNTTGQFQGLVNLLGLNDPHNPIIIGTGNKNFVFFNPCTDMRDLNIYPGDCAGKTVCYAPGDNRAIDYGQSQTAAYTGNLLSDAVLSYTSADGNRSTTITLVCDPDQRHSPSLTSISPVTDKQINLELRTVCACPGGCQEEAISCVPQGDCSCKLPNNLGTYSLQGLDRASTPLHAIGPDQTNYYYNPCSNMTISGPTGYCKDVAACMVTSPSGMEFALGEQELVTYHVSNFNPDIFTLTYNGGSGGRSLVIEARCDHTPNQLSFEFIRADPSPDSETATFYFLLQSDKVCPHS